MFKIGVVEFDCGHDSGGARYGDTSVYKVEIDPGCLYDANAMRWQLQGYKGKIVGVTWDDDPMVDGIYRLDDVSVSPIQNYLATGRMSANVVLKRMPDLMEASYVSVKRAGSAPFVYFADALHGKWASSVYQVPDDFHVDDNGGFAMDGSTVNGTPDGIPVDLINGSKTVSTASEKVQVIQGCVPSLLELGRATIEVDGGDGWWLLTGETIPEGYDVRFGNGRVRLTIVQGRSYFLMELYSGTDWEKCGRFSLGPASAGAVYNSQILRRFVVNRNDRAQVALSARVAFGSQHRSYRVDLTVERGSGVVKFMLSRPEEGVTSTWDVRVQEWDGTATATTAFTTGLSMSSFPVASALFGDTGAVASTVSDNVVYTGTLTALFGVGHFLNPSINFRTDVSVNDSSVY